MLIGCCNNFPSYAHNRSNNFTFLKRKFSLLHIDGAANVEMASCGTSKRRISSKDDHRVDLDTVQSTRQVYIIIFFNQQDIDQGQRQGRPKNGFLDKVIMWLPDRKYLLVYYKSKINPINYCALQECMCLNMTHSISDVPESRVWFASKNMTPCRMHLNDFLIGQIIAECHKFPNMYDMLQAEVDGLAGKTYFVRKKHLKQPFLSE